VGAVEEHVSCAVFLGVAREAVVVEHACTVVLGVFGEEVVERAYTVFLGVPWGAVVVEYACTVFLGVSGEVVVEHACVVFLHPTPGIYVLHILFLGAALETVEGNTLFVSFLDHLDVCVSLPQVLFLDGALRAVGAQVLYVVCIEAPLYLQRPWAVVHDPTHC